MPERILTVRMSLQSSARGDWHSHPAGVLELSRRDKRTLRRIGSFEAARVPEPVMLITAGPPWTIGAWRLRGRWLRALRCLNVRSFDSG
jgi:proteasome lid subunit RPN8/RPN11